MLNSLLLPLPREQLKLAKEPHQAMIVDKDYERISKVPLQVWPKALVLPILCEVAALAQTHMLKQLCAELSWPLLTRPVPLTRAGV